MPFFRYSKGNLFSSNQVTGGGRTFTELSLSITPDPSTGKGGIADISSGLTSQNLPDAALTQHTRHLSGRVLHQATGEHPYHAPQQVAKGAQDAGAAALRAPSSLGGSQIDILPANAAPASITPVRRQTLSPTGVFGPVVSASTAAAMPAPATENLQQRRFRVVGRCYR